MVTDTLGREDTYQVIYNNSYNLPTFDEQICTYLEFKDHDLNVKLKTLSDNINKNYWVSSNIKYIEPHFNIAPYTKIKIDTILLADTEFFSKQFVSMPEYLEYNIVVECVETNQKDILHFTHFLNKQKDVFKQWDEFCSERFILDIHTNSSVDTTKKLYVNTKIANIREGPNKNYKISYLARLNDTLYVIDQKDNWLKVQASYAIKSGWIYSKLTSNKKTKNYKPKITKSSNSVTYKNKAIGRGEILNHSYTYMKYENKYTITFSPFLPRNDAIVIGAMLDVINNIYGKHKITNLQPQIVSRAGTNLIQFDGMNYVYLFLLIKEDTGEVHSFNLWREKVERRSR